MKKRLFAILLLLQYGCAWSEGQTLTATVKEVWTVQKARNEALANLLPVIDVSSFQPIDPNYQQNRKAIAKRQTKLGSRTITIFDDHSYNILEDCAPISYYYTQKGELEAVQYPATSAPRCPKHYPNKDYKYSYPDGQLMFIGLNASFGDNFLFSPNGQLVVHWKGNYCHGKNGAFCGTRHAFKKTIGKTKK